jgi:two-component system cell cycle response regulator
MTIPLRRRTDADPTGLPPLRALVVEDDENYANYVSTLLRRFGFTVTHAATGPAAMVQIDDCEFDVAVIDQQMPGMSGLELITAIRAHQRCGEIYALMLTGQNDLETKIAALRLGFDDFVTKSTSDPEMVAKLGAARRIISRQRRLDATVRELYGLATRDELTGLFNRRYFFAEADRMLAEGIAVSLVLFDLDEFKRINDTYGHLAGDRILRDVGSLFLRRTRHDDLIARYGGDELVLIAAHASFEEAVVMAHRIVEEIASMRWTFGGDSVSVGVSTGAASSTLLAHPTVGQLLNACDRDLYKNKWLHTHPNDDPALYEYDTARHNRLPEIVDFRSEEGELKKESS